MSDLPQGVRDQPQRLQDRVDKRFAYLRTLEQNWDSYGADPLQPGMEERARKVLKALSADFSICLTVNGGICLEDPDMDVMIEIEPNEVTALIDDRDLEEDGGVRAENKALKEQNERLRDRRGQLKARVDLLTTALTDLVEVTWEAIPFVGFEGYLPERTEQLRYRVNAARAALTVND